jgi:hypothetical protein
MVSHPWIGEVEQIKVVACGVTSDDADASWIRVVQIKDHGPTKARTCSMSTTIHSLLARDDATPFSLCVVDYNSTLSVINYKSL